jgi:hypothetical protein
MKRYSLVIPVVIFFLIINTLYFWESKLGGYAMLLTLLLIITYIILSVSLFYQFYLAIREKFANRSRLIISGIVATVLILSFFYPFGVINYQKFEAKDLLIAGREGVANCNTTLKLKANNNFIEQSVCFGVYEVHGRYSIKGDSIFFSNIQLGRGENEYYQFAVITKSEFQDGGKILGELKRFKNYNDTLPHDLFITKNEFKK